MNLAKYSFETKEQYEKKINALYDIDTEGNKSSKIKFADPMVLGHIVESEAAFDELNEILTDKVMSTTYHVDMAWYDLSDHPLGWKMHYVNVDGNGLSCVSGLNYNDYKF